MGQPSTVRRSGAPRAHGFCRGEATGSRVVPRQSHAQVPIKYHKRGLQCKREVLWGVPTPQRTENGEQKTERAGAKRQTFHGYREETPLRGDKVTAIQNGISRRPSVLSVLYVLCVLPRNLRAFRGRQETQGMGTVVRRNAPNGEVPRPLRSFGVFVEMGQRTQSHQVSRSRSKSMMARVAAFTVNSYLYLFAVNSISH